MPILKIVAPSGAVEVAPIRRRITSIGRAPDNDVVLADRALPDTCAQLRFDGESFLLAALDGAWFSHNGKRRTQARLSHDDRVVFGSVELVFSMFEEAPDQPRAADGVDPAAYRWVVDLATRTLGDYRIDALLDALMDGVVEITRADKGFIVLLEGGVPEVKVARNFARENIADAVAQLSDSIVAKVLRTARPMIVSDALRDEEFKSSASVLHLKLCSVMCVPLQDKGEVFGLIYVGNDRVANLFREDSLEVLSVFAALASLLVRNALLVNDLHLRNRTLSEEIESRRFGEIIGSCPAMQEVFRKVEKIAGTDVTVLITGETGTGKELVAREIHRRSPRAKGPFVSINCGAIPESLLESELFGHVRGAFTGAVANRPGRFQAASGGTLFLDEIAEMPPSLQVKLLRALQERAVVRVGDSKPEPVDIRVVAATNRDLAVEMREGRFREDLYYRLNVVGLHLPPLRERGDDLEVIARYLLARHAEEYRSAVKGFSPAALAAIRQHPWPGNIRQLDNHIKKAVLLCDRAMVGREDLDLREQDLPAIKPLAEARAEWERRYVIEALARNDGNRSQTAKQLGVDQRTVFRYLAKVREGQRPDEDQGPS